MTEYEGYKGSAFEAMVQSELVKYETRESDNSLLLEDSLDQLDVEDLEEKFDWNKDKNTYNCYKVDVYYTFHIQTLLEFWRLT